jgi:hypothetical protein
MPTEERPRKDRLFEVRAQAFTNAMDGHQWRGRAAYESTERFITWSDIGIDVHNPWRLNGPTPVSVLMSRRGVGPVHIGARPPPREGRQTTGPAPTRTS